MIKIKILTITLLTSFGISYVFFSEVPTWLWIVLWLASIPAIIFLNTEAFKLKGSIMRLTIWADIVLAICLIMIPIPSNVINIIVTNYLIFCLILVYMGLIVAVLVSAYHLEKIK